MGRSSPRTFALILGLITVGCLGDPPEQQPGIGSRAAKGGAESSSDDAMDDDADDDSVGAGAKGSASKDGGSSGTSTGGTGDHGPSTGGTGDDGPSTGGRPGGAPSKDDASGGASIGGTVADGPATGGRPSGGVAGEGPVGMMVQCPDGLVRCAERCIDIDQDPMHCGSCDSACPDGSVCDAGNCATRDDCTETPCVGLSYCDLISRQCRPGCASDGQCGASERCDLTTHECVCSPGFHDCSDVCVSDSSSATCGTLCSPCPAPDGGSASCTDGLCVETCPSQLTLCGGSCLSGVICDLGTCEVCPAVPNGQPECNGNTCAARCDSGYALCDSECRSEVGGACSEDADCCTDQTCCGGTCKNDRGTPCTDDVDCCDGLTCCQGVCTPERGSACTNDSDCCGDDYEFCFYGACDFPYSTCSTNDDCYGDASCLSYVLNANFCTQSCTSDSDCPADWLGQAGQCYYFFDDQNRSGQWCSEP